jgi:hypothetical protein
MSQAVGRTRMLLAVIVVFSALAITGCSAAFPQGTSGSIALLPFWDEEQGIKGVQPLPDWTEEAQLRQIAVPQSRGEVVELILPQIGLSVLPESTGRYRGKGFTWDLYEFESHMEDVPVDIVHFDLAIADSGLTTYIVGLLTLPDAYDASPALYDTVFTHVLYALEPME